jgi:hypothetical protein
MQSISNPDNKVFRNFSHEIDFCHSLHVIFNIRTVVSGGMNSLYLACLILPSNTSKTSNKQQATSNKQQATSNNQQSTINNQQSTINNSGRQLNFAWSAPWCSFILQQQA